MITESFHKYKNWDFRIRAVTLGGISADIFRDVSTNNPNSPTGIKRLYLRTKTYNFMLPDMLIQKTKNFIDNHESNLIMSLENKLKKYNEIHNKTKTSSSSSTL